MKPQIKGGCISAISLAAQTAAQAYLAPSVVLLEPVSTKQVAPKTICTFKPDQLATVRARLAERGETVQDFCQQHRLSYHVVMAILHGRSAATRGEGHRAAVLMGLKRPPPKRRKASAAAPVSPSTH